MKSKASKHKLLKKRYVLAIIVAAFIVATYFFSAKVFNFWPFHSPTKQAATSLPSPKPGTPSPKNNAATEKGDTQPAIDPNKTADQVPVSPTMNATITSLKETDQEIHFAATVSNSPTAGICVVTFSNPNDRPVTKQVNATVSNGIASCGPLTISANEFSYLGTWQVTFHYYLDSTQATAQSAITIQ